MNRRTIVQTIFIFALLTSIAQGHSHTTNQVNDQIVKDTIPPYSQISVATQLKRIPILQQGSFSGLYNREEWIHWIDYDHDCQNTRAEVLIAKSIGKPELTPNGCRVIDGTWIDPYSGAKFIDPTKLDIDHIVPLKWANGHGGSFWSFSKKQEFANDFANLVPVDSRLNRQKGNKGPDEWMPPRRSYRCEYLKEFTLVVRKYGLALTTSEKKEIGRLAVVCSH